MEASPFPLVLGDGWQHWRDSLRTAQELQGHAETQRHDAAG